MGGRKEEDECRLYTCFEGFTQETMEKEVQVINIYRGNAQLEP